jgi:DNA-binding transcriptional ArsR family regulator
MPRARTPAQPPAGPREQTPPRQPAANSAAERRRATQELRALAHPLRLRLIEHFARGPRTTMQVAADLGEPPTRLYHHVNALERAGILRLERTRQVRGTTEKYYGVAKRKLGIIRAKDVTPGARASLRGLATVVFDEAREELLAAMADPSGLTRETAPIALRMLLTVPPSHQKRVRRRIMATVKAIQRELKGCDKESAEGWALTMGFAPTVGKTVAKK